jgi:hypothetical protein
VPAEFSVKSQCQTSVSACEGDCGSGFERIESVHTMISSTNYKLEENLVDEFVNLLGGNRTPWGKVSFSREFDYARGRTDVVAVADGDTLIAVEAKLKDWKYALHQAYRNTCFAHQSFVLLPKKVALAAAAFRAEFERRGVGLCYIDCTALVVIYNAPVSIPLEPWLALKAISHVRQSNKSICRPALLPWSQ